MFVDHQSPAEVAIRYGVHRAWVYKLKAGYEAEGETAFEPGSRRPKNSPNATPTALVDRVLLLRKQLAEAGLDAGAETIGWRLQHHHRVTVSRATINRILTRAGAVIPQPAKRPKSSYTRFQAWMPNQTWQSDITHYRLADGSGTEIISWLDDCARYALSVSAHVRVTGPIVLDTFRKTAGQHGIPASTLTDNGMVYTVRWAGGRGGRNAFEHQLRDWNVVQKNSRANHPTTCGKVERFQQTMKKWLAAQPVQPTTIAQLQALLNAFVEAYNHHRPHRSLPHRATPAAIYHTIPKALPGSSRNPDTHDRIRHDRISKTGNVTLRVAGRLRHIGVGRTHAGTHIILLVQDLDVRIVNAITGELLRQLTIDPSRDYQPTGAPKGPPAIHRNDNSRTHKRGSSCRR